MGGEWREKPLSELSLYLNRGAAPAYTDQGGILVLNQKCIRNQTVNWELARRTDPARKPIREERMLQPYDIVVNSTGVGTLGRVAQVIHLPEPATVDSHITIIRPDPQVVDPYYLGMAVRCFERVIEQLGEGSTGQTELRRSRLAEFAVPVPESRAEQRAIARILGALDDKIELNRRMNETLEAMAQALFKSWFVDFDPVVVNAIKAGNPIPEKFAKRAAHYHDNPDALGLPEHILRLFPARFVDSKLGPIPEGWEVGALQKVFDINPPRYLQKGSVAPYLSMANTPTKGHMPLAIELRAFSSGTPFINGDTLLARITPCLENGKTAFVDFLETDQVGWGSTEFIVLRPKPPLPPEFGYLLARHPDFRKFAIKNMTGTSGRQRVPPEAIGHYEIVIPSESVAHRFGHLVRAFFSKARAAQNESHTLADLRDTLLPKLISGELRVPDVEKILEDAV
ncbi:restriction endonuclease subunit S [Candidatus Parcubacteria bacterium]|nr:MAG: restriction endonuclease subunit S [Candidatus Parcubacteria bacterium]